jgi:PAS domain-containing protein
MINKRKQSEQGLKRSHQLLQAAIDAVHSHLAILSEDGLIITVNKAWRQFADANGLAWDDYGVGRNYL